MHPLVCIGCKVVPVLKHVHVCLINMSTQTIIAIGLSRITVVIINLL